MTSTPREHPDYYTAVEVAQKLGTNRKVVLQYLRDGRMPGRKVGNAWRIPIRAFELWMIGLDPAAEARGTVTRGGVELETKELP